MILDEVLRPQRLARRDIEAQQVAHRAERVNLAVMDQWRGPRTGRATYLIGAIVGVRPQNFSGLLIEAKDALLPLDGFLAERILGNGRTFRQRAGGDKNATLRDGRAGVAHANRRPPTHFRPALRKLVEDAGFLPDPVAIRSKPLRPVVGSREHRCQDQSAANYTNRAE